MPERGPGGGRYEIDCIEGRAKWKINKDRTVREKLSGSLGAPTSDLASIDLLCAESSSLIMEGGLFRKAGMHHNRVEVLFLGQ